MAKITTKQRTVDVRHPHLPEVVATCRVLDPLEAMDLFGSFQEYQKVRVVTDDHGNPLRNDDGEFATRILTNLPTSAVIDVLKELVIGVVGLEDEDGKPIPFKNEESFLKYLFARELAVKHEDGSRQSFADYIQAHLNKLTSELNEEESKAPKGKTSLKRA